MEQQRCTWYVAESGAVSMPEIALITAVHLAWKNKCWICDRTKELKCYQWHIFIALSYCGSEKTIQLTFQFFYSTDKKLQMFRFLNWRIYLILDIECIP